MAKPAQAQRGALARWSRYQGWRAGRRTLRARTAALRMTGALVADRLRLYGFETIEDNLARLSALAVRLWRRQGAIETRLAQLEERLGNLERDR